MAKLITQAHTHSPPWRQQTLSQGTGRRQGTPHALLSVLILPRPLRSSRPRLAAERNAAPRNASRSATPHRRLAHPRPAQRCRLRPPAHRRDGKQLARGSAKCLWLLRTAFAHLPAQRWSPCSRGPACQDGSSTSANKGPLQSDLQRGSAASENGLRNAVILALLRQ